MSMIKKKYPHADDADDMYMIQAFPSGDPPDWQPRQLQQLGNNNKLDFVALLVLQPNVVHASNNNLRSILIFLYHIRIGGLVSFQGECAIGQAP